MTLIRLFLILEIFLFLSNKSRADLIATPAPTATPSPAVKTAIQVKSVVREMLGNAPRKLEKMQDLIWENERANACEILIALGTDAAQVVRAGTGGVAYLRNVSPGIVPVPSHPGYTITPQENGSVACATPTPSPSPSPAP